MVIQATAETIEKFPDIVCIRKGLNFRVSMQGRRQRYFRCGGKGHVRSECEDKQEPLRKGKEKSKSTRGENNIFTKNPKKKEITADNKKEQEPNETS